MKAITLTQPWATLVAIGAKGIETRSWSTRHRGPLAIHAGVGLEPVGGMKGLIETIEREPFATVLRPHLSGYTPEERARDLPRGAIIAVVSLTAVMPTHDVVLDTREFPHEVAFGDYSSNRFAWWFERVVNLHDGIECKGALGLWNVPKEVREELADIDDRADAIQL